MAKTCDMTQDEQDELRDRFAMASLTGMLANEDADTDTIHARAWCRAAYAYADEMLKARDAVPAKVTP